MIGYIYIITNLINNNQYVGQTIQSIEKRFKGHISSAKNILDNTYLHKSMRKYGIENFKVDEIKFIEEDNIDLLNENLNYWEKYYISYYNTLVPNGYNLTKGGAEGAELYKRKIDEYDLNGKFLRTHDSLKDATESVNAKTNSTIYKCCIGKCTYAFKRIWRYHGDSLNKYKLPDKTVGNREYKIAPIDQYSKDGKFIKTYNSISEINIINNTSWNLSHISECCKGKLYNAYDYVWRYQNEPFDKFPVHQKRFVKCEQYDLNDNFICKYNSIKEACEAINKSVKQGSNITLCCKGKIKTAFGYKWKYAS